MHRVRLLLAASAATATVLGTATAATAAPGAAVFTVSPAGKGTACSTATPCSLDTAQGRVRSGGQVVLTDGTYRLSKTLTLSGPVTYRAAPGAHPVLSGGEQVTGWHATTGGVWAASVPAGTQTRQLYVNGVRANRAEGPDPTGFTRTATGYTTSDTTLASWKNITDVEFVYNVGWTQMRCGVAAVAGTTVTMDQPCFDNSTRKPYGVNADRPDRVENARELLDRPGEFYLDQPAHTVYYMPRPGQDLSTADVELPVLQTLLSGTGNGITVQGLSFEYAGWTEPDGPDGFSEVQANMRLTGADAWEKQGSCYRFSQTDPGTCPYGNWTMTPGNVVFDGAASLQLIGNTFRHLGAAGLQLGSRVTGSIVRGNVVTDTSGNGIEIGDGTEAALPSGNTIDDNWVHHVAVDYSGGVGIFQGYARDDTIAHNQVNDVPYSGISSNWGWGHTPQVSSGDKILNNLVFDHMQLHSDGGGIYVLGQEGTSLADGLTISGNVVRNGNSAGGGHAIYTDGGSQFITMTGNAMFADGVFSMGGCREGNGTPYGDFSYTGNYVEETNPDWPCGAPDNATISNTQVGHDGTGVPASLLTSAGLSGAYAQLAAAPAGCALPANLAAGKPVQAQFLDGTPAQLQPESQLSYATDSSLDTYVQASGQFRWQLVVDLQASQTLGSMTVSFPQPHFATDFHVDASTDAASWTTVGTVHDGGWGTVPILFPAPMSVRYLRIVADKPDDWGQRGDQMAISGVAAYASSLSNAAVHKPAQALFIDGTQADLQPNSQPAYATDGDPGTWTQATGRYRWISQVDLGRATSVNLITLLQPDVAFATAFHVDASLDGASFVTVARRIDAGGGLTPIQLDRPIKARYLRVVADRPNDGGQTGGQMAVSELGAY
jgi:hypothetical protein